MRGIGIQISRLEISKTKNKGSLINFLNKTEKAQTRDKILESGTKDRYDSHFGEESKSDSSKESAEPSLTVGKDCVSNMKTDNLSSRQFSESTGGIRDNEHVTISPVTQTESSTITIETENKTLHNRKENENTTRQSRTKELFGKSDKKITQKQSSQETFFKHVKSSSGKSSKYEMPRIQDIDMSVLIELPDDIRNEILNEYKRNKAESRVDPVNEELRNSESSGVQESCSQVDPDVLSALMKSDLHPDVQRDVQMYCDMKKEANKGSSREKTEKSDNDSSKLTEQAVNPSSQIYVNSKGARSIVNNADVENIKESVRVPRGEMIPHVKIGTERAEPMCQSIDRSEISRNDADATDKADTFILQNLSILHNNENVDKHQEMLINLVNHLFTLPLQQVLHNHSLRQKVSRIGTELFRVLSFESSVVAHDTNVIIPINVKRQSCTKLSLYAK